MSYMTRIDSPPTESEISHMKTDTVAVTEIITMNIAKYFKIGQSGLGLNLTPRKVVIIYTIWGIMVSV